LNLYMSNTKTIDDLKVVTGINLKKSLSGTPSVPNYLSVSRNVNIPN
jgi:hypothetical protein